ncbi:hypothetical protein [Mycoplasma procyoni]|uniref:hypothetical protein n=1 Tax=Mycoplasma procyoni TaxID=568784 RepID=UPI00197B2E24|nr:hypothetical protein [Mycoplasma procyoni]MBN3534954.1 hypothetical protein [Mycoplasma procyoni]
MITKKVIIGLASVGVLSGGVIGVVSYVGSKQEKTYIPGNSQEKITFKKTSDEKPPVINKKDDKQEIKNDEIGDNNSPNQTQNSEISGQNQETSVQDNTETEPPKSVVNEENNDQKPPKTQEINTKTEEKPPTVEPIKTVEAKEPEPPKEVAQEPPKQTNQNIQKTDNTIQNTENTPLKTKPNIQETNNTQEQSKPPKKEEIPKPKPQPPQEVAKPKEKEFEFSEKTRIIPSLESNEMTFDQIKKESFMFDKTNLDPELNYEVSTFVLNEDENSLTIFVKATHKDKSEQYAIKNFTAFKSPYTIDIENTQNQTELSVKEDSITKKSSQYTIDDFMINNPVNNHQINIDSFTEIIEDQQSGLRTSNVQLSFSKNNKTITFTKTISWDFETDAEIVERAANKDRQIYQAKIDQLINKDLLPREFVEQNPNFSYTDEEEQIHFKLIQNIKVDDYDGVFVGLFEVKKNDAIQTSTITFNSFNKIIAQDKDYKNTNRIKAWDIKADAPYYKSWKKEYVFDPVGAGGKIGQNYWYNNSNQSKDIIFEIVKKDKKPIYIEKLELIFLNYTGYHKENNDYYSIQYQTHEGSEWKNADTAHKTVTTGWPHAIPHAYEQTLIRDNVYALRVVFKKGQQPNWYVTISSLMPFIKQKNIETIKRGQNE